MNKYFKIKNSSILHKGRIFDLRVDEVEYASGNIGIREVAVHQGGAAVVAVKDDGKIILISQYRYPFNKNIIELPAGKLDKGEDPFVCALRELEEETGYRSTNIIKLGEICTTPGFCTEILHLYLAKDLIAGSHNREEGELEMEVFEFTLEEIEGKILSGEIADAKTICGIYLAKKHLGIS